MNFRMLLILSMICQLITNRSHAQGKAGGIAFFSGSWKAVLEEAGRAGKPVMVDMYTTWCPPCKKMDKEVFPRPEIGGKYNQSFICYKVDAEKGEGPAIKKKYEVTAYPTYLFINEDGILVHKAIGYHSPADFLKVADEAEKMSKEAETVRSLRQQYENGNREPGFLQTYINKLASLNLRKTQQIVLDEYIAVLPDNKRDNVKEIGFILKNLVTADSKAYSVIADRQPLAAEALALDKSLYTEISTGNPQHNLGLILGNIAITSLTEAISQRDTLLLKTVTENARKIVNPSPLFPYSFFAFKMQFYKTTQDTAGLVRTARSFLDDSSYYDSGAIARKNQRAFDNFMSDYRAGKRDSTAAGNFQQQKNHFSRRITKEAARMLDMTAKDYYRYVSSPEDLLQAIEWSKRSITLINDEPSFYQTLADLYTKTGQRNKAIACQEKALRAGVRSR